MAKPFPHRHHSPGHWLRRLDRAADAMNPFLAVLAIGLALLNLTCLVLLALQLPIAHRAPGHRASLASPAENPAAAAPTTGDRQAWTLF